MSFDLTYLADCLAALSTLPVRVVRGGECAHFVSLVPFPRDPFFLLPSKRRSLGGDPLVFGDESHGYYGAVCHDGEFLVVGPNFAWGKTAEDDLRVAFAYGIEKEERDAFLSALRAIQSFPMTSFCEILCILNYACNQRKFTPKDIIFRDESERLPAREGRPPRPSEEAPHGTLGFERKMLELVKAGNWPTLKRLFTGHLSLREGNLAKESLRQTKNLFIVTATLVSRSAIEGGLGEEKALSMSDAYIRRAEALASGQEIMALQYRMIEDYCLMVAEGRGVNGRSKLVSQVNEYVARHMDESIRLADLSSALGLKKSTLERRFSAEAGESLAHYVLAKKIAEAKRMLASTEAPLSAIAYCLGFSSQPHFNKAFRQMTGTTPGAYRLAHGSAALPEGAEDSR